MAPKVIVPMDFGRHLLKSPTHNNLKLNTNEGGEVLASSVILSFNSPVIDHVTTTLHMTSVDLLEFAEAAVQLFVDCAYSGTAGGITLELFRDVNKIANVLEVAWLIGECSKYFNGVADSMKTANYSELLFLFEEAAFAFENLKMKEFLEVAMKQIEKFSWKQQFIENYLNNADRLSTKKLDLVIELAGQEVEFVVQKLTQQLSDLVLERGLPNYCRYLLDNSDLSLCKKSNDVLFNSLFSVLDTLPDNEMRWTFSLLRKSTILTPHNPSAKELINYNQPHLTKINASNISVTPTTPSKPHTLEFTSNIIFRPKLSCLDDLYKWLYETKDITNILVALEVLMEWDTHCVAVYRGENSSYKKTSLNEYYKAHSFKMKLDALRRSRGWLRLPSTLIGYKVNVNLLDADIDISFLCSLQDVGLNGYSYMTASLATKYTGLDIKLYGFYFRHPFVTACDQPGFCGFALKTVCNQPLRLTLCTEKHEYDHIRTYIHFHHEIKAKNVIHLFHIYDQYIISSSNNFYTKDLTVLYKV